MNTQKIRQTIQYTYSESFRQIYDQKPAAQSPHQHSESPSPSKIFIQYQKASPPSHNHNKKTIDAQKFIHNKVSQTIQSDNPVKRLHNSAKKYSFSIFVKKNKKYQNQKKNKTSSLEDPYRISKFSNNQKKIKGTRQINSVIRTMYDNFKKFENKSKLQLTSKSSRKWSLTDAKHTPHPQEQTRHTTRQMTNLTIHNSSPEHHKTSSSLESQTSRTRSNFIKTLSFGQKLQHSRELQNFRSNETPKRFLTIGQHQIPLMGYQETQYEPNCFLKIEKCSLQKKDALLMKHTADFRDIILKDRLEKDNKKKAQEFLKAFAKDANGFLKYAETVRENKYVAEMRGVKKTKKKWPYERQDEIFRNKISPW